MHRKDRKSQNMKVHHVPISQSVEGIELGKGQEGGFNPGEIPEDSSGKVL